MPVRASVAAAKAIAANPGVSDDTIAKRIGVGRATVQRAREKQPAQNGQVEKRTGRDGKSRKMPKVATTAKRPAKRPE